MPRSSRSIPRPARSRSSTTSIVEDGGMLVNPMIVDGQIYGGVAQGIGTALYEEMPFDAHGPAARLDLRRLPAAGPDRGARSCASSTWRRRRPTPNSARRASARAAPSRRRPRSPTPSTMRCKALGASCSSRRSRRAASSRRADRAALPRAEARVKPVDFDYARPRRSRPRRLQLLAGRRRACEGAGRRADARPDAQSAAGAARPARRHHARSRS